ncbi:hypothetical protein ACFV4N_25895 [Actinosynnema sp. NPDC059797]
MRPGNRLQGYVLRRLARRAVRFAFDLRSPLYLQC